MKLSLYDSTRLNSMRACPRKYLFEHVFHWRPDAKSAALIFGSAWHDSMDSIWRAAAARALYGSKKTTNAAIDAAYDSFCASWVSNGLPPPDELGPDELDDLAPRTPQIAREMLYGYVDARRHIFEDPSFELLAVEQPFAVPLSPTDASIFYVGRLDKVFSYRGLVRIGEHKSGSAYKKNGPFRSDFIDSFGVSAQIDGYLYALRMLYAPKTAEVWIDAALVHKTEHDAFQFIPEARAESQLDSWLWETHHYIDQIKGNRAALAERAADDTPYLAAFPRNTNSCTQYGRCAFLDICRVTPNPARLNEPPLGYKIEAWSPFSIVKLEEIGLKLEETDEPFVRPAALAAAAASTDASQQKDPSP